MNGILSLKPIGKKVLVMLKGCDTEKNGILLPGNEHKLQNQGTIVATPTPSCFAVGQQVIFEEINEDLIFEEEGKKYALIDEEHIMAILTEEEVNEPRTA